MSVIIAFWKKRTTLEKLFLIIIVVGFIYTSFTTVQKGIYKYRYYKAIENDYRTAKDSIEALNLRLKDLTQKQEIRTKTVQKKAQSIQDKLKQDEEIIDNRDYTDDELDDFIAKYQD